MGNGNGYGDTPICYRLARLISCQPLHDSMIISRWCISISIATATAPATSISSGSTAHIFPMLNASTHQSTSSARTRNALHLPPEDDGTVKGEWA
ncbi:hypothetical protein ACLKA7_013887 [Drosophila subpalustris]